LRTLASFFLTRPRRHHSSTLFPTRRSSDLLLDAVVDYLPSPVDVPPVEGVNPENEESELRLARDDQPFAALAFKIMNARAAKGRSEEHTSELQSPYELVCRLLLEKKKDEQD